MASPATPEQAHERRRALHGRDPRNMDDVVKAPAARRAISRATFSGPRRTGWPGRRSRTARMDRES